LNLLIACLGLVAIGLPDGAVGVAWPAIRAGFDLPQDAFGLLLTATSAGVVVAGLVSGRLMQAMAFPSLLFAAVCAAAGGIAIEAAAPGLTLLCLGALVAGLGAGSLDSAVNAAASMRFGARQINWIHGCYGIGATIGPLLMTAIIVTAGLSWRAGYAILAGTLLLFALDLRRRAARAPAPTIPPRIAGRDRDGRAHGSGWAAAARHPLVLIQVALFFVYTGVEVMLGQWSYTVLTEARGVSPAAAGAWVSAYWISLTAGRFALSFAIDHVGPDRLLRLASVGVVLGTFAFCIAPEIPAGGLAGELGLMLAGLSLAPIFPTLIARAPERLGAEVALHAVGFKVSAAMVGGAALPAAAGVLAQTAGLDAIPWLATAGALVLVLTHELVLARSPRPARVPAA
jgi:fucose permease